MDRIRHFFYFSKKSDAEAVAQELRGREYSVTVREGGDGWNWLALAAKDIPVDGEDMHELHDEMEFLAAQFGGEYDGWETEMDLMGLDSVDGESVN